MQANELKEQLAKPTHRLFVDDDADVDLAREVGMSVGGLVFDSDDPAKLVDGIINMEAYFYHLRSSALIALKEQLGRRYQALEAIARDQSSAAVRLVNGETLPLPGHTAPALNELVMKLEPVEGGDNPRLCLELIQQTARLMQVMGLNQLTLRDS